MHAHKRLTPSIVLCAPYVGDIAFFEASVAILANVPLVNARILIHDAGRLGLKSLYMKSGLPPQFLRAVRIAIEVIRDMPLKGGANDRVRYRARTIERILSQCEDIAAEDLDYLLKKLGAVHNAAPNAAA